MDLPNLSQNNDILEKTGLIVNDIETLIRHYDKLGKLERLLANKGKVKDLFNEQFKNVGNSTWQVVLQHLNTET